MGLADLRADVRDAAIALRAAARAAGEPIAIASTTRTPAEQDRLCRTGYSRLCGAESAHVHGLAFDVALVDSAGRPEWPTDDAGIARWTRVGQLGEGLGLIWGGRWASPDWPHFQSVDAQSGVRRRVASRGGSWRVVLALAAIGLAVSAAARRRPR